MGAVCTVPNSRSYKNGTTHSTALSIGFAPKLPSITGRLRLLTIALCNRRRYRFMGLWIFVSLACSYMYTGVWDCNTTAYCTLGIREDRIRSSASVMSCVLFHLNDLIYQCRCKIRIAYSGWKWSSIKCSIMTDLLSSLLIHACMRSTFKKKTTIDPDVVGAVRATPIGLSREKISSLYGWCQRSYWQPSSKKTRCNWL